MTPTTEKAAPDESGDGFLTVDRFGGRIDAENTPSESRAQALMRAEAQRDADIFRLSARLHRLGPRVVGELLLEVHRLVGDHLIDRLRAYAEIGHAADFIDAVGADWLNERPEIVPDHLMEATDERL